MSCRWRVASLAEFATLVRSVVGAVHPGVVAINGYSSSGKTSLANRLVRALPGAAVVHTDDLAWHQGVFDWDDLLVGGILKPLRNGEAISYRPPAWQQRSRVGAIEVSAGTDILLVEGVGAGRRSLADQLDAHIWVTCYTGVRVNRTSVRVAAGEMDYPAYRTWDAEEIWQLLNDRPWERADLVVAGDARLAHDPLTQVVVASRS